MDALNDATDALEEVLDYEKGDIKLMVGESFVDVGEDAAESYVERKKKEVSAAMSSMKDTTNALKKRQADLRKALYGRFGQAINLEGNPEQNASVF